MKAAGIVRNLDGLGRIVIPKEIRKTLGLEEKAAVEIFTDDCGVYIKKYQPECIFCKSIDNVIIFEGKKICLNCLKKLNK